MTKLLQCGIGLGIMVVATCLVARTLRVDAQPIAGVHQWIFLKDKGPLSPATLDSSLSAMQTAATLRNLQKRAIAVMQGRLFDFTDLPVYRPYLDTLQALGLQIRTVSRWLNAVSVSGAGASLSRAEELPWVDSLREVRVFRRSVPSAVPPVENYLKLEPAPSLDYGPSLAQLAQIHVPQLHDRGLTGEGILIGVFDTGFDTAHPSIQPLDIEATHDFINGDEDVRDGADEQRSHGTYVLSAMGGYDPGQLIGPAYHASFCLAKTEIVAQEIQQEEDNFVAALEWADSIGCRIVSASLGYNNWYQPQDFDGNTAVTTVACDLAVKKGICVVVANGNEGPGPSTMLAPADGDSVIAVGAVNVEGTIAQFSSRGPTADGRIKPDICADGVGVHCADWTGGYTSVGGTSLATPLVAGSVALLLEDKPNLTPVQIRAAIWTTAQRPIAGDYPNNDYGFGILDATAAAGHAPVPPGAAVLAYPNPFEEYVTITFRLPRPGTVHGSIHALDGVQVWSDSREESDTIGVLTWNGRNADGREVAAGVYLMSVSAPGVDEVVKLFKVK